MNYEIRIGEVFDLISKTKKPKQTIIITEEQMQVLETFAHTKRDSDLNTIYVLNECEFRMVPVFDFDVQLDKETSRGDELLNQEFERQRAKYVSPLEKGLPNTLNNR